MNTKFFSTHSVLFSLHRSSFNSAPPKHHDKSSDKGYTHSCMFIRKLLFRMPANDGSPIMTNDSCLFRPERQRCAFRWRKGTQIGNCDVCLLQAFSARSYFDGYLHEFTVWKTGNQDGTTIAVKGEQQSECKQLRWPASAKSRVASILVFWIESFDFHLKLEITINPV